MTQKFESTIGQASGNEVAALEAARKTWRTPQVIEGTLDEAENGAAGAADGGPTPPSLS